MGVLPALPRWIPACAGMTKSIVCEAEADQVLGGFELVAGFDIGCLCLHGANEEARDCLTVVGEVADVLLESALDAHMSI